MWIYVCGDNERTYYLREEALKRGHRITCPHDAQVIVLPLPVSVVSDALKEALHRGQTLICGITEDGFTRCARENGWKTVSIYEDEVYQTENAEDSAEGAVFALMREAPFALKGKRALVIGFGRLGRQLQKYLSRLGVKVTVAARDPVKRALAGEDAVDIKTAMDMLGDFDMIVNTAPAQIVGRSALDNIRKDALLMDTASAPYGFNLEEAKEKRIRAWRENGIPGRYCPKTAAERLMNCIERSCTV